jgi:hypothetical protein
MPKPNPNFAINLGVMITTILGSTWPKHLDTKILQASLFAPSPIRPETSNTTQKFPKKQQ